MNSDFKTRDFFKINSFGCFKKSDFNIKSMESKQIPAKVETIDLATKPTKINKVTKLTKLTKVTKVSEVTKVTNQNNQDNQITNDDKTEYIVIFKRNMLAGASQHLYQSLEKDHNLDIQNTFHHVCNGFTGKFSEKNRIELEQHPNVDYIVKNTSVRLTQPIVSEKSIFKTKSGTLHNNIPWGIEQTHPFLAERRHTFNLNVENGNVYIIDMGVETSNPNLNVVSHVSFVPSNLNPMNTLGRLLDPDSQTENNGHATHVAGIIGKKDTLEAKGFTGVAPGIRLHSVQVLDSQGDGQLSWILKGIDYCVEQHMKAENQNKTTLVNMSLGFESRIPNERNPLDEAIIHATNLGLVFVVAAGNSSIDVRFDSPAHNQSSVITVGAHDQDNRFCDFSNFGSQIDVSAPGQDILSTWIRNTYQVMSGTSMATPHITGAIALFLTKYPYARVADIKIFLKENQSSTIKLTNLRSNTPNAVISLKRFPFASSFSVESSTYYPNADVTKKKMMSSQMF